MNRFLELEIEEFDWFESESEISESYDAYQEIEDLKQIYEEGEISERISVENMEDMDGVTWRYCETLQESMDYVFSQIYENLCGYELKMSSDILTDYVDVLNKKCVVLQSDIISRQTSVSSVVARIDSCLSEGGSVVMTVADGKWRELIGEQESCFLDSGLRIVQVTGQDDDFLWISDCTNKQGKDIKIDKEAIGMLDGILMEVYK